MTTGRVGFSDDLVAASSGAVTDGNNATVTIVPAGPTAYSCVMTYTSGTTTSGNTGAVRNDSGVALGGTRGDPNLMVGSGNTGHGGLVETAAGESTAATERSLTITSDEGTATTSGAVTIRSPSAGAEGLHGAVVLGSGSPGSCPSGSTLIRSGAATPGVGGAVSLTVVTGAYTTDLTFTLVATSGVTSGPVSMAPEAGTKYLRTDW